MASLNEQSIEFEARRRLAAEREAARQAALENQRRLDREMAELAARERDQRVAFEAERIEAQRKAEEAMIAAKAKAEKEAYDAAVAKKLEEMRSRPEVEVLRAELEELRGELSGVLRSEISAVRQATPWAADVQAMRSQISACPWNNDVRGLQTQLATLQSSINELKGGWKKPARQVSVYFSSGLCHGANEAVASIQPPHQFGTHHHPHGQQPFTLNISYCIIPQNVYAQQGAATTLSVNNVAGQVIQVPEGSKVFVISANANLGSLGNRDMTHFYKAMLETQ